MIAGHTHCGQIRLPLIGAVSTMSAYGDHYACGRSACNGRTLIVSAGLGTSILPLRLGAVPDMRPFARAGAPLTRARQAPARKMPRTRWHDIHRSRPSWSQHDRGHLRARAPSAPARPRRAQRVSAGGVLRSAPPPTTSRGPRYRRIASIGAQPAWRHAVAQPTLVAQHRSPSVARAPPMRWAIRLKIASRRSG